MREADFTSAHFLGALLPGAHPLGAGPEEVPAPLTSGRPAAVEQHEPGRALARRLARAQGAGDAVLARTSLHGLVDVLATRRPGASVLVDEAVYPVGLWAARTVGAEVTTYRHHDARDAARRVPRHRPAVLLTDGLCGSCLRPAPLAELTEVAQRHDGEVVVDDTLAAGVLGRRGTGAEVAGPLGSGGAGLAAWLGVAPADRVVVASLAKGLAAPLAVVSGPALRIDRVRRDGPTRVHTSPPTSADVAALDRALATDLARRRVALGRAVLLVRGVLERLGLRPLGVAFPLLATEGGPHDPLVLQRALAAAGVRTLATTGRCTGRPTLSLCLRADHSPAELARLEAALAAAVAGRAA